VYARIGVEIVLFDKFADLYLKLIEVDSLPGLDREIDEARRRC
jgi:hypothetical protein